MTIRPTLPAAKRRATLAGALTGLFLLGACASGVDANPGGEAGARNGSNDDTTSESPDATDDAGEVTRGGTLRFAVGSDSGCVDPQQVGSNDTIYSVRQLVDSLTDQDPDTGEIVPWLAESWEVNEDATAFTFTLHEGATFSDGAPVDADAVKANLDRIQDLGARGGLVRGYLTGYTETEVVDDGTFTVHFETPNAQFLQATSTHSLGLLAPATVELTDDERCAEVIGSGPFVLDSYTPNAEIVLAQRPDYDWGSSGWEHTGPAYLDRLEFSIVPESGVRTGSLLSGQVDAIGNIAPQDEAAFTGSDIQLHPRSNPGIAFALQVNHDNPVLSDPAVREAVSWAINRQEIIDTVHTSFGLPATSALASTTPQYVDLSDLLGFDPARTEQILTDAGWTQEDGGWTKDGQELTFDILWFNNAATNGPTLELIQQQLGAVGIPVTLTEGQVAEWQTLLAEGSYDTNWSNSSRADGDILRTAYSTELANNYRLEASELDDLLTDQAAATEKEDRDALLAEAQQFLVENYYGIPVVELTTVLATGPDVHGLRYDASSRIHLYDTWLDQSNR